MAASDITQRLRELDFTRFDATHNPLALRATLAWVAELSRAPDPAAGDPAAPAAASAASLAAAVPAGAGDDPAAPVARHAPAWLLLYGGMGTGKTHLLAAAFYALLANKRYPVYTLTPALLDHVREGLDMEQPGAFGARFHAVQRAPILILDDLGAEKRSEWSDELLFKLLDYRYREALPTAVATNLIPADLEPRIASRLQDRALSTVVMMRGPDYRLTPRLTRGR